VLIFFALYTCHMTSILALDLGGTRLKWGLVSHDGVITEQDSIPSAHGERAITEQIATVGSKHRLPIGLAMAGDIDRMGTNMGASNLGLGEYNPARAIHEYGCSCR
jgi:predicted NBD/HSP70 family sugar kinase